MNKNYLMISVLSLNNMMILEVQVNMILKLHVLELIQIYLSSVAYRLADYIYIHEKLMCILSIEEVVMFTTRMYNSYY